jgi:predicted NAD-dependent protein-ADP-ribosyltransferase YbiA (DUF1768 family)
MSETIHFYSTKGDYGCFSNFAAYPISLHGKVWPTSEHYSVIFCPTIVAAEKTG